VPPDPTVLTPEVRLLRVTRRFLVPRFVTRLLYLLRFRTFIGPLAEVEHSRLASWGPGCVISSFTKVKINGPFRMGRRVHIASGGFIEVSSGGLEIGDDVLVGPNCSIVTSKYTYDRVGVPLHQQPMASAGVSIGARTWIGAGSSILDGTRLGEDCIVSAGSVVSGAVPPRSILAGNPARVIFTRR
jgi:acetyltransferase-like isoleucine patch superfamily enzyme